MSAEQRRFAVQHLQETFEVSERRACRGLGFSRNTHRYRPKRVNKDKVLSRDLHEYSLRYPRRGYRYIGKLLRKEKWPDLNIKRVHRLWRLAGLQVPSKARKRRRLGHSENGIGRRQASRPNEVWSYDFLFDVTERGQTLKMMPILDEYTRECLALVVDTSITAKDVVVELEHLFAARGLPEYIRSDNGPEYIAQEVKAFLEQNEIKPLFIEPGSPWENGYSESFNSRFREECLNRELISHVREGRVLVEEYRIFYNTKRLHSALNYETPEAFARNWQSNVSVPH